MQARLIVEMVVGYMLLGNRGWMFAFLYSLDIHCRLSRSNEVAIYTIYGRSK